MSDDTYRAPPLVARRRRSRPAVAGALVRAARPGQWVKNVLLLAAPAAAGVLDRADAWHRVALAFAAFAGVSSGGYLLNDVCDAPADRRHPRKRHRPVAAGEVSERIALCAAAVLVTVGFVVGAGLGLRFAGLLAGYAAVTASYSLVLRHVAVLDLAAVAGCHAARAAAGGAALAVPLSRWFVMVTSFGALFVVAGKRLGDLAELGDRAPAARTTLATYSRGYLRYVLTLSSSLTITAYCLWAFEPAHRSLPALRELSALALALFILRYALLLDGGRGGAPEELIARDRALCALAAAWVALFAGSVYI